MSAAFAERRVEVDGFSIRYVEAGEGPPLSCLHGAGGLRLSRAHELLAETHRVVAFEVPGFGESAANERSSSMRELAGTMRRAVRAVGIERGDLWGTSFGGKLALWMAIDDPGAVAALVLIGPAAIRLRAAPPTPEETAAWLFAHPERQRAGAPLSAEVAAKQRALVARLIGPAREPELEEAMRSLEVPTLVLFGSEDRMSPPELGRHYRELLPKGHFVIVYDAAHAVDGDRPEALAAIVNEFLEHGEGFVVRHDSGLRYP